MAASPLASYRAGRWKGQKAKGICQPGFKELFEKPPHVNDFCLHFSSQRNAPGHANLQRRLEISFLLNQEVFDITATVDILTVGPKGKWI